MLMTNKPQNWWQRLDGPLKVGLVHGRMRASERDRELGRLPAGVEVRSTVRGRADVVVFFATRRAELVRRMASFERALSPGGSLWVAWPKRTSGVATDLTFEPVQEIGNDAGLVDGRVCPLNAAWSSVRFQRRV